MGIFSFLIYLGILNIIFGFVWKWIFVLPSALLLTAMKLDRAMILVKAFGAYLLVSLTALFTLIAIGDGFGWKLLIFPLTGGFVLFMGFAQNLYEQRKQASIDYDFALIEQIEKNEKYDLIIMFGSIILFVLVLFFPFIAINPINSLIVKIIQWIFELPIIGFLIGVGGFLFMLSFIWYGFIMLMALIGGAYGKIRREAIENNNESDIKNAEIIEGGQVTETIKNENIYNADEDSSFEKLFVETNTKFCNYCGKEINISSKFCKYCGKNLN